MPPRSSGAIEVLCGPMFSGKTEELIRRLRRAQFARLRVQAFKPAIDQRYEVTRLASHSAMVLDAEPIHSVEDLANRLRKDTQVVGIDEAQFLSNDLLELVQALADRGVRVVLAGLDLDYLARPFGPMPTLLAIADEVVKCHAVCSSCGGAATRSQRLSGRPGGLVLVGAADSYEPRCRACFEGAPTAHTPLEAAHG